MVVAKSGVWASGVLLAAALTGACGSDAAPASPNGQTPGSIQGTPDAGQPSIEVPGLGDAGTTPPVDPNAPTWHKDIAPLVHGKCTGCHKDGGIAPFSLESYDTAKAFAGQMASAVADGTMPPFLAQDTADCKPRLPWQNDIRLTDDQKAMVKAWAEANAPEGDPATAAPLPPPPSIKLEREDVTVTIPDTQVDGSKDIHMCVVLDPKLANDTNIVGRLITAGNAKILHHVVSYIILPGTTNDLGAPPGTPFFNLFDRTRTKAELEAEIKAEKGVGIGGSYDCFGGPALDSTKVQIEMLDAWAPGGMPNLAPPDSGQPISKDSLILLDVHYHPTGAGQEKDSGSHLALMVDDTKPKNISRTVLIGNFEKLTDTQFGTGDLVKQPDETTAAFVIPAGAKDHVEEMTWTWKQISVLGQQVDVEFRVFGMGTHMHYVGRDMQIQLVHSSAPDAGAGVSADADAGVSADAGAPVTGQECLIETPKWDFNWQRGYGFDGSFDQLPVMKAGDVIKFRCVFDNSMDNPFVVQALDARGLDAPVEVHLGEDTLDEMCLGAFGIIYPNPN